MFIDDQNPGQEGEGEDVTSQEGEESQDESTSSSDPLDAIEDEEARAEAKRHRAIARRLEKKGEEKKEDIPPTTSTFATKEDLKKLATNDAKKIVSEEIKQLWDELVAVPLGGFDPLDSESIAQNMEKRYALYIMENPDKAADPSTGFTASPDITANGGGAPKKPKTPVRPLPGYKEPTQPTDWYPAP